MSALYGYDPPLDLDTKIYCPNLFCSQSGEWWHPEIVAVGQIDGRAELKLYAKNAFDCPECDRPGQEMDDTVQMHYSGLERLGD